MVLNGLTFHAYRGAGNIEIQGNAVIRWAKQLKLLLACTR